MQTGIEVGDPESIEFLAREVDAQIPTDIGPDPSLEAQGDPAGDAINEPNPNKDFCCEVIACFCKHHADGVRSEFTTALEPHAGSSIAARIADRAAMSPALQATIAEQGANVLDKYGLAKYINAEAALGAAIITYYFELSAARRERDAIINPPPKQ